VERTVSRPTGTARRSVGQQVRLQVSRRKDAPQLRSLLARREQDRGR
jgi:hypothetical protein